MRYLALDIGDKRIGVAVGNSVQRLATPLAVIARGRIEQDAERISAILREYDIDAIVVGLPRHADDTPSEQEKATLNYISRLAPHLNVPIHFHDERYSTWQARQAQRERGLKEAKGKKRIDSEAAAVFLQDFLDGLVGSAAGTKDDASPLPFEKGLKS